MHWLLFLSCRWIHDIRGPLCRSSSAKWPQRVEDGWCSGSGRTANRAVKTGQPYPRMRFRARERISLRHSSAKIQLEKTLSLSSDSRPCFQARSRLTKHSTKSRSLLHPRLRLQGRVLWAAPECLADHLWSRGVLLTQDRELCIGRSGLDHHPHFHRFRFAKNDGYVVVEVRRCVREDCNVGEG